MHWLFYYLSLSFESALSMIGIRTPYEQPRYAVVARLSDRVEIRRYAPALAIETPVENGDEGAAFGRLFRTIAGANHTGERLAMTVPVERGERISMTVPVEMGGTMRFFLPYRYTIASAPRPNDPKVRVVDLPARTVGVIRYGGLPTDTARTQHEATLRAVLIQAGRPATGPASFLSYDPPFALPFVRRNEVMAPVAG